jgi:hypothetical protein
MLIMAKKKLKSIDPVNETTVKVLYLKGSTLAGEVREISKSLAVKLVKNRKVKIL